MQYCWPAYCRKLFFLIYIYNKKALVHNLPFLNSLNFKQFYIGVVPNWWINIPVENISNFQYIFTIMNSEIILSLNYWAKRPRKAALIFSGSFNY